MCHYATKPFITIQTNLQVPKFRVAQTVNLYHTGTDSAEFPFSRVTLLSIHPDGFDHVENLTPPITTQVRNCKAWFYRNDHSKALPSVPSRPTSPASTNTDIKTPSLPTTSAYTFGPHFISRHMVKDATEKARVKIEELVNNPSACLRDIDAFGEEEEKSQKNVNNDDNDAKEEEKEITETATEEKEESKTILVNTTAKMREYAAELLNSANDHTLTELAFDLESLSPFSVGSSSCLFGPKFRRITNKLTSSHP